MQSYALYKAAGFFVFVRLPQLSGLVFTIPWGPTAHSSEFSDLTGLSCWASDTAEMARNKSYNLMIVAKSF